MLVLLPPSETKRPGGDGAPLQLADLVLPELTDLRAEVLAALVELSGDEGEALRILGLGPRRIEELAANTALLTAPTDASLTRYTGVLYDALDVGSLTPAQRARADASILIGSALFGVTAADDPIPAYRLSPGNTLPGIGPLRGYWRRPLATALHGLEMGLAIDLRSGAYQQLGPVDGAISVSVLTEKPDGSRAVVSHFNKHHKGLLARALLRSRTEPTDIESLATIASAAGLRVEIEDEAELAVITE